jgi:hypothetical protein
MEAERLNLQQIDQQATPRGSDLDRFERSRNSDLARRSDGGSKLAGKKRVSSFLAKVIINDDSDISDTQMDDMDRKAHERKILYRVSKKIYTPDEIEFIRSQVLDNKKGSTKKFLHWCTSVFMISLIIAMFGCLMWRIVLQWTSDYQINLTAVDVQDPSISNFASTVSVVKYFMYDNSSKTVVFIDGEAAIPYSTAYTNVSLACGNTNAFIDTESIIKIIKDSTNNAIKLFYDLLFILVILACLGYIIYRTFRPLKIHRIPLIIRSNNVSPWSYKQRFKL